MESRVFDPSDDEILYEPTGVSIDLIDEYNRDIVTINTAIGSGYVMHCEAAEARRG